MKVFSAKILFPPNCEKFSPSKVSRYTVSCVSVSEIKGDMKPGIQGVIRNFHKVVNSVSYSYHKL